MIKFLISGAVLLTTITTTITSAIAAPKKDEVEVRFLAERIPRNLGKVVLAIEETRSDPVSYTQLMLPTIHIVHIRLVGES